MPHFNFIGEIEKCCMNLLSGKACNRQGRYNSSAAFVMMVRTPTPDPEQPDQFKGFMAAIPPPMMRSMVFPETAVMRLL
jgi:hypothetical protein